MDFSIVRDDITAIEVGAVVLPANPRLKEGTGATIGQTVLVIAFRMG